MFYERGRFYAQLKKRLVWLVDQCFESKKTTNKTTFNTNIPTTENKQSTRVQITLDEALRIIEDYGKVLRASTHTPFVNVVDAQSLPHPKLLIKEALILAIRFSTNSQKREQYKVGLLYLADWQEGVGKIPSGVDLMNIDLNKDARELAEQFSSGMVNWESWSKIQKAERDAVESELREKGLW